MTDPFDQHRGLLFTVAYDLLGSVADAEDVVQESWLRWSRVDHSEVREPRPYLVRIVTRQALNRVRSLATRRENYVGPWLPEPLITEADPAELVTERAARAEAISVALLVVLETLSPDERAVFVLREVFAMAHDEIAHTLDRSPASVRQLAHRAREHVHARRPRSTADATDQRRVTERFLAACATGDLEQLLGLLAPDVTLTSDGGGKVKAALRPVHGADKVARFLIAIAGELGDGEVRLVDVNGELGVIGQAPAGPSYVGLLEVVDGLIHQVFIMANPDKLSGASAR